MSKVDGYIQGASEHFIPILEKIREHLLKDEFQLEEGWARNGNKNKVMAINNLISLTITHLGWVLFRLMKDVEHLG